MQHVTDDSNHKKLAGLLKSVFANSDETLHSCLSVSLVQSLVFSRIAHKDLQALACASRDFKKMLDKTNQIETLKLLKIIHLQWMRDYQALTQKLTQSQFYLKCCGLGLGYHDTLDCYPHYFPAYGLCCAGLTIVGLVTFIAYGASFINNNTNKPPILLVTFLAVFGALILFLAINYFTHRRPVLQNSVIHEYIFKSTSRMFQEFNRQISRLNDTRDLLYETYEKMLSQTLSLQPLYQKILRDLRDDYIFYEVTRLSYHNFGSLYRKGIASYRPIVENNIDTFYSQLREHPIHFGNELKKPHGSIYRLFKQENPQFLQNRAQPLHSLSIHEVLTDANYVDHDAVASLV